MKLRYIDRVIWRKRPRKATAVFALPWWVRRPKKKQPYAVAHPRKRRRFTPIIVASGNTTFVFPSAAWLWNGQAPLLSFNNAAAQKDWVWQAHAPAVGFNIAGAQKQWLWKGNGAALAFNIAATLKQWVWRGNAPSLAFNNAATQKQWLWKGNGTTQAFAMVLAQKAWQWKPTAAIFQINTLIAAAQKIWAWVANAPTIWTSMVTFTRQPWIWLPKGATFQGIVTKTVDPLWPLMRGNLGGNTKSELHGDTGQDPSDQQIHLP